MIGDLAKTILVVDDSIAVRQMVAMALRRAGFSMVEAADGKEGLAMVDSNRNIVMVICDINMPTMNGLEMVERVKAKPENKDLPILMLTTEGQPSLVKRAKEAGAIGWIVKPFDTNRLIETVQHLAKRAIPRETLDEATPQEVRPAPPAVHPAGADPN